MELERLIIWCDDLKKIRLIFWKLANETLSQAIDCNVSTEWGAPVCLFKISAQEQAFGECHKTECLLNLDKSEVVFFKIFLSLFLFNCFLFLSICAFETNWTFAYSVGLRWGFTLNMPVIVNVWSPSVKHAQIRSEQKNVKCKAARMYLLKRKLHLIWCAYAYAHVSVNESVCTSMSHLYDCCHCLDCFLWIRLKLKYSNSVNTLQQTDAEKLTHNLFRSVGVILEGQITIENPVSEFSKTAKKAPIKWI